MKPPPSDSPPFLAALRQSVERLDVILSLNQDIWQSAFVPRLSGGLADRLSEVVVELKPLTEEEMVALARIPRPGSGGPSAFPCGPQLGRQPRPRPDPRRRDSLG